MEGVIKRRIQKQQKVSDQQVGDGRTNGNDHHIDQSMLMKSVNSSNPHDRHYNPMTIDTNRALLYPSPLPLTSPPFDSSLIAYPPLGSPPRHGDYESQLDVSTIDDGYHPSLNPSDDHNNCRQCRKQREAEGKQPMRNGVNTSKEDERRRHRSHSKHDEPDELNDQHTSMVSNMNQDEIDEMSMIDEQMKDRRAMMIASYDRDDTEYKDQNSHHTNSDARNGDAPDSASSPPGSCVDLLFIPDHLGSSGSGTRSARTASSASASERSCADGFSSSSPSTRSPSCAGSDSEPSSPTRRLFTSPLTDALAGSSSSSGLGPLVLEAAAQAEGSPDPNFMLSPAPLCDDEKRDGESQDLYIRVDVLKGEKHHRRSSSMISGEEGLGLSGHNRVKSRMLNVQHNAKAIGNIQPDKVLLNQLPGLPLPMHSTFAATSGSRSPYDNVTPPASHHSHEQSYQYPIVVSLHSSTSSTPKHNPLVPSASAMRSPPLARRSSDLSAANAAMLTPPAMLRMQSMAVGPTASSSSASASMLTPHGFARAQSISPSPGAVTPHGLNKAAAGSTPHTLSRMQSMSLPMGSPHSLHTLLTPQASAHAHSLSIASAAAAAALALALAAARTKVTRFTPDEDEDIQALGNTHTDEYVDYSMKAAGTVSMIKNGARRTEPKHSCMKRVKPASASSASIVSVSASPSPSPSSPSPSSTSISPPLAPGPLASSSAALVGPAGPPRPVNPPPFIPDPFAYFTFSYVLARESAYLHSIQSGAFLTKFTEAHSRPQRRWFYCEEQSDEWTLFWGRSERHGRLYLEPSLSSQDPPRLAKGDKHRGLIHDVLGLHYGPSFSGTARFGDIDLQPRGATKVEAASGATKVRQSGAQIQALSRARREAAQQAGTKPWLCFSIECVDRTYDILCASEQQLIVWLLGIQSLIPRTSSHFSRAGLTWRRLAMKVHYFTIDDLRAKWLAQDTNLEHHLHRRIAGRDPAAREAFAEIVTHAMGVATAGVRRNKKLLINIEPISDVTIVTSNVMRSISSSPLSNNRSSMLGHHRPLQRSTTHISPSRASVTINPRFSPRLSAAQFASKHTNGDNYAQSSAPPVSVEYQHESSMATPAGATGAPALLRTRSNGTSSSSYASLSNVDATATSTTRKMNDERYVTRKDNERSRMNHQRNNREHDDDDDDDDEDDYDTDESGDNRSTEPINKRKASTDDLCNNLSTGVEFTPSPFASTMMVASRTNTTVVTSSSSSSAIPSAYSSSSSLSLLATPFDDPPTSSSSSYAVASTSSSSRFYSSSSLSTVQLVALGGTTSSSCSSPLPMTMPMPYGLSSFVHDTAPAPVTAVVKSTSRSKNALRPSKFVASNSYRFNEI